MGYESKIYIVEKYNTSDLEHGKRYARDIVAFDLSKVRRLSRKLQEMPETDCYFYADDGNTQVLEDKYGNPLTECSPEKLLELVRHEIEVESDHYSVYFALLATLESIVEHSDSWGDVVCLHYGY